MGGDGQGRLIANVMDLRDWDERYRSADEQDRTPTPLVVETAQRLKPGKALDLACGAGRNALWLAEHGWRVTAVDGSPVAIDIVKRRARDFALQVDARVVDLERGEFHFEPFAWDLILSCYYLQRDLFEPMKIALRPGGALVSIVHITDPGEEPTYKQLPPGELETYFPGWEIVHRYEGDPRESGHRYRVAEVVVRRPTDQKGRRGVESLNS